MDLATPNFVIQEMVDPTTTEQAQELVVEPLPVLDGYILPPEKPGIGVEVDEAACARRKPEYAGTYKTYVAYHSDGSVADS